ncbi:MAG: uroporphyrinogen-III C-methyltransferase [Phycisphaerales bacterium]|nr:MAG: uroporphyrinogen-III C-methyltransferase [Phycisphaerales bacterium]
MGEKSKTSRTKGFVYLVGAGPGKADLITVRGAEALGKADCVIYDKLANPALLKFARKDVEIVHVPKRIGKGSCTQDEINKVLVEKASAGKIVVRLKGGDPCVFGRASEELVALTKAGIRFEIVPGVTAGVAVASYAGVMLTDKDASSQVAFITGQEAPGKEETGIDWDLLAQFNGTVVFYMGIGNLESIATGLIDKGTDAATPAAVIANVTFPTQRVVRAPLARIHQECKQQKIKPPAIVVIGAVAGGDMRFDWFTDQPLFGKTIIVTRDTAGNADSAGRIIARGGNPLPFATLRIKPLTNSNEFLRTLTRLGRYEWIIFTSGNGVTLFFEAMEGLGKDARIFGPANVAAIGTGTANRLAQFGVRADFVPDVFTGRELGKQLMGFTNLQGKRILLLRSKIASNELVEILEDAGAQVDNVPVYTAVTEKRDPSRLVKDIREGTIDWVTFASPSSADGFFEQVPAETVNSSRVKVASIGPVTSERLKQLGIRADVTAKQHTIDGLLNAIEHMETR